MIQKLRLLSSKQEETTRGVFIFQQVDAKAFQVPDKSDKFAVSLSRRCNQNIDIAIGFSDPLAKTLVHELRAQDFTEHI